ncbi:glycosyltransferase family 4 protein [Acuticoccus sp.]|uniref:glycosyltransferase family 4 protein n=1 Tax=Acuticoccus sp. TaxID=1904378 RepID=UPI003B5267AD
MNVLFVLPSFHTNLAHALSALCACGVTVRLIVRDRGRGTADGVDVCVRASAGLGDALTALRAIGPDLVVVRKAAGLSRPFALAATLTRRPLLGYDLTPLLRSRGPVRSAFGVLRGRPVVRMTPVHGLPGRAASRADPRAVFTPFPPALPGAFDPRRGYAPDGAVRILCVAKLAEARKEVERLLAVLETIDRPFTLTLAGSTSLAIGNPDPALLKRLRTYPAGGRLAGRVRLVPDAPFAAMDALYRAHDLCVLPARREPLGVAPLEAMARGCAAIVSDECGSAGHIALAAREGPPVGTIFRAGDDDALRGALTEALDPSRCKAMGRAAGAWCASALSAERFVAGFARAATMAGATVGDALGDAAPRW